jgi:hypothetical protein
MKQLPLATMRRDPAVGDPLAERARGYPGVVDRLLHQHPRALPGAAEMLPHQLGDVLRHPLGQRRQVDLEAYGRLRMRELRHERRAASTRRAWGTITP